MVDGAGFENQYARKGIEGSNPSLSAKRSDIHTVDVRSLVEDQTRTLDY